MNPDKKRMQMLVMGVLVLALGTVCFISFRGASSPPGPPPSPLNQAIKHGPASRPGAAAQATTGIVEETLVADTGPALAPLPRRDPFAQQHIAGEKLAGDKPKAPAPARAQAPSTAKVPVLNPFSQTGPDSFGRSPYSQSPIVARPKSVEQEKEPSFVLTGVVRGSENVAIIRVGDKERHIVKQGQTIDGGYKLLSISNTGVVLVHNNRRIHCKIGGVKNAS